MGRICHVCGLQSAAVRFPVPDSLQSAAVRFPVPDSLQSDAERFPVPDSLQSAAVRFPVPDSLQSAAMRFPAAAGPIAANARKTAEIRHFWAVLESEFAFHWCAAQIKNRVKSMVYRRSLQMKPVADRQGRKKPAQGRKNSGAGAEEARAGAEEFRLDVAKILPHKTYKADGK